MAETDPRRGDRGQRQVDVPLLPQDVRVVRPAVGEAELLGSHDKLDEALRGRVLSSELNPVGDLAYAHDMPMSRRSSVEDYFEQLAPTQRPHLELLRELSLKADKQEPLLSPFPAAILRLPEGEVEGAGYEAGEGFIKLPYDREVPVALCKKLMQARIDEYEATGADWSDD